jgi:hypothetical protein
LSIASAKSTLPSVSEACRVSRGRLERIQGEPQEKLPPRGLWQWLEFSWLSIADARFRASQDKRKLYFERCMTRGFKLWFCC